MCLKESRILTDNIHNVTGHDSFVVLSSLHFGQSKQVLDYSDQEALLCLLVHGTRDGTDSPTEGIAVGP